MLRAAEMAPACEMAPAWGGGEVPRLLGDAYDATEDADAEAVSVGEDADACSVCSGCHDVEGGDA